MLYRRLSALLILPGHTMKQRKSKQRNHQTPVTEPYGRGKREKSRPKAYTPSGTPKPRRARVGHSSKQAQDPGLNRDLGTQEATRQQVQTITPRAGNPVPATSAVAPAHTATAAQPDNTHGAGSQMLPQLSTQHGTTNPTPTAPTPPTGGAEATATLLLSLTQEMRVMRAELEAVKAGAGIAAQSASTAQEPPPTPPPAPAPSTDGADATSTLLLSLTQEVRAMRAEREAEKATVPQNTSTGQELPLAQDDDGEGSNSNSESDSDSESEGECDITLESDRPVRSGGLSVLDSVPRKLKRKIWKAKYIDLALLLDPDTPDDYDLSLGTEAGSNKPAIKFKKTTSKRQLSPVEWCTAFGIYMAVYLAKHPNEINHLFSYQNTIHRLMRMNANWRWYDKRFRSDQELKKSRWDSIRPDLERDAYVSSFQSTPTSFHPTQPSSYRRPSPFPPKQTQFNIPKGYCYSFHTQGQRCQANPCTYKHACPVCGHQHPRFRHNQRGNPNYQNPNYQKPTNSPNTHKQFADTNQPKKPN